MYNLLLSVIIVNYNVKYFLEQCLCSVIKAIENIDAEIFVVDNNSTDHTREFFLDKFRPINFIWNTENVGFSKANNIALRQSKGEFILFLNPDTIVPEDGFTKCISFFRSNAQAGALGIKMLDGSGKFLKESKRSFPSPITSLYKLSGLSELFSHSKIFSKYHLGNLNENEINEVDVLAGAFLMVPEKVIDVVGSFDELFFMYGEDIDLSYRIQQAGFKNFYFPEVQMLHFKGESTKKGSLNYVRLFYSAMSKFAKKNYGSGKATLFNFFIQIAIFVRAFFSACARFLKWIGMPAIDTAIILLSFWTIKLCWSTYIKKEVNYSPNMFFVAFPVFTSIFLLVTYFTGLYDNGYQQRRLNQSALIAFLTLLSFYALLPETWRFSRGILVFGCLLAFIIIAVVRWLLIKWKIIERAEEDHDQTIVVGSPKEFHEIFLLLQNAGMKERVLGRVSIGEIAEKDTIGSVIQLKYLLKNYPIKEIIFCEGKMLFKQMIQLISELPRNIKVKIHAAGATSIIGSDSKNMSGKIIAANKNTPLTTPLNIRNKRVVDVILSILFIATFPLHLMLQKKQGQFYKNVLDVLKAKKTWVGCAGKNDKKYFLKQGVLTPTGLPSSQNTLPSESLDAADSWYATDYTPWQDIKIIFKGYKYLSA